MNVLTILFAGLIAHVMTPSGVQRAVLVAAPGHVARLIISSSDVIETEGIPEVPEAGADRVFLLDGEHITLSGVEPGPVLFEDSYLSHVPSLSRISDGTTLLPEIDRGQPHPSVAAYIDLPSGTFSVQDVYSQQVSFREKGMESRCLARAVTLRADTKGDTVDVRTINGFIRIRANATLRVENDPLIATGATHFHMYASLFTDASYVAEPAITGGTCGTTPDPRRSLRRGSRTAVSDSLRPVPSDFGPSCSNSNYP